MKSLFVVLWELLNSFPAFLWLNLPVMMFWRICNLLQVIFLLEIKRVSDSKSLRLKSLNIIMKLEVVTFILQLEPSCNLHLQVLRFSSSQWNTSWQHFFILIVRLWVDCSHGFRLMLTRNNRLNGNICVIGSTAMLRHAFYFLVGYFISVGRVFDQLPVLMDICRRQCSALQLQFQLRSRHLC